MKDFNSDIPNKFLLKNGAITGKIYGKSIPNLNICKSSKTTVPVTNLCCMSTSFPFNSHWSVYVCSLELTNLHCTLFFLRIRVHKLHVLSGRSKNVKVDPKIDGRLGRGREERLSCELSQ